MRKRKVLKYSNDNKVDNTNLLKHVSSDGVFDVYKIPIDVLDKAYTYYSKYLTNLGHNNKLRRKRVLESIDYMKNAYDAVRSVSSQFKMDTRLFSVVEANNKIFIIVLSSYLPDNIESIEKAMEMNGFFRSQKILEEILFDEKKRKWVTLRFEPIREDDVTDEVKDIGNNIAFHLAPSIFEESIKQYGLIPSNNNAEYRYYCPRIYVIKGNTTMFEINRLASDLYRQAQKNAYKNLTTIYTLFKIDLSATGYDVRFYYDPNESTGIFTDMPIDSEFLSVLDRIDVTGNKIKK